MSGVYAVTLSAEALVILHTALNQASDKAKDVGNTRLEVILLRDNAEVCKVLLSDL